MNYLTQISNTRINNILFSAFIFAVVVFLSLIPSGIIRVWVFSSVFKGTSKSGLKRIRKEQSTWQWMTLCYLLQYRHAERTKKRLIAYWIYWVIVLITATMSSMSVLGFLHYRTPRFLFFPLMLFDVIIWIIWVRKGKRII